MIKNIIIIFFFVYIIILYIMHINYTKYSNKLKQIPSKNMYLIKNFLDKNTFENVSKIIEKSYNNYNIRNDNFVRKGGSFSHHQMYNTPLEEINILFDNLTILNKIKYHTGLKIQYIPKTDQNRLGVLIYKEPKDGINWHYDGNNYYGNRWVGIYTVKNKSKNRLNYSNAKFKYIYDNTEYSIDSTENSLLLFRGDKIKHKVDSLGEGEIRIVISLLFCDICERKLNPIDHIYQSMVNLIFYGKI